MNITDRIRELCQKNGLSVTKLEEQLHFGNGSITKAKTKAMGSDRLYAIAQYFQVSMEYLMTGYMESQNDFSLLEREIIQAFRSADFIDQNSVLRILGLEKKEELSESKTS